MEDIEGQFSGVEDKGAGSESMVEEDIVVALVDVSRHWAVAGFDSSHLVDQMVENCTHHTTAVHFRSR